MNERCARCVDTCLDSRVAPWSDPSMAAGSGDGAMNHAEWLALAGLVRLMVHSDGVVSRKEHRFVSNLAQRFGSEAWSSMAEAELRLTTEALVQAQAARVVRVQTRKTIRALLEELAVGNGVGPEERAILDWLDQLWFSSPER